MVDKISIFRSYDLLIEEFVKWAEPRPDIRAAMIIGSRARQDRPADEWADLDMVIVTTNPGQYVSTADWVKNMGNPLLTFMESTVGGDENERRVLYEGMLDVDFAIFPVEKMKQFQQGRLSPQMEMQIANAVGRGMRILLDKDGTLAELRRVIPSIGKSHPKPPTPSEFLGVISDFLYHTVWTAKHLLRGELWWADTGINCRLSNLMLRMMEWHAQALHEWKYDTWFRGRFLEHWADQRTLTELKALLTHYDEEDTKRSLIESLSMFRRIATETSRKLGYDYPGTSRQNNNGMAARLSPDSRTQKRESASRRAS